MMARPSHILIGLSLVFMMAGPAASCEMPLAGPLHAGLDGIAIDGDVALADGTRGRLPGLRMRIPAGGEEELAIFLSPWASAVPYLLKDQAKPDRWSRHGLSLTRGSGADGKNLAMELLKSGFAIAWPAELPPNCRNLYLQAEGMARDARQGIWKDQRFGLLDASNGTDVAVRAGEIAVMNGRVNHVGQTRRATYLNFGARGTGASAEIGLGVWRDLERQGWTRERFKGQAVRVRGVISEARPARMLVLHASALEVVD